MNPVKEVAAQPFAAPAAAHCELHVAPVAEAAVVTVAVAVLKPPLQAPKEPTDPNTQSAQKHGERGKGAQVEKALHDCITSFAAPTMWLLGHKAGCKGGSFAGDRKGREWLSLTPVEKPKMPP